MNRHCSVCVYTNLRAGRACFKTTPHAWKRLVCRVLLGDFAPIVFIPHHPFSDLLFLLRRIFGPLGDLGIMCVASIKSDSSLLRVVSFTNRMIANVGVQHRIITKQSYSRLISLQNMVRQLDF